MTQISTALLGSALDYIKWDPNIETRREIQLLLDKKDGAALKQRLGARLQFGTAGLRGPMGGGYSRMNDLVILQTSQGLIKYLLETVGEGAKGAGLVIGYDHRKFGSLSSLNFARMCAAVFLRQGFQVYLLEDFVATPLVAFAVRKLGCCCGVMVTASHNPKRDNGFKVHWGSGSQIIPPHDAGIAAAIDANLAPWQEEYDCDNVLSHPLAKDVTDEIADAYYAEIVKLLAVPRTSPEGATAPRPRLAYTAMHGVGRKWIQRAFRAAGLSDKEEPTLLSVVPSQAEPDADFPTVIFPNPEEKGALDEAMRWASAQGCPVIIANDPDADRLAAAELVSPGQWRVFTGNEIGVLLGHWLIRQFKASAGEEVNPQSCFNLPALPAVLCRPCQQRPAVLASVVSSRMLSRIAAAENIQYFDTLTGFKWLGNKAASLQVRPLALSLSCSLHSSLIPHLFFSLDRPREPRCFSHTKKPSATAAARWSTTRTACLPPSSSPTWSTSSTPPARRSPRNWPRFTRHTGAAPHTTATSFATTPPSQTAFLSAFVKSSAWPRSKRPWMAAPLSRFVAAP